MATDDVTIEEADFPPISPMGEAPAPADPGFVTDCLSELDHIRALGNVKAIANSLTINKTWGLVFRADFTVNGPSTPDFVNRIICWRLTNGEIGTTYALGLSIPPLAMS